MSYVLIALAVLALAALVIRLARRPAPREIAGQTPRDGAPQPPLRLPSGVYDLWAGEGSLLDPQLLELDRQLAETCNHFRTASPDAQRAFRASTTEDNFYTLLQFAKRASVVAMRERDERWIHSALAAAAIVDVSRIDAPDLLMALSIVHHAASSLRLDARTLFKTAAGYALPETAEVIREFSARSAGEKSLEEFGYAEIEGPAGVGLIESEFESYNPTLNLVNAALAVEAAMHREGYVGGITIASNPPSAWLSETTQQTAEELLDRSRATVSLYSGLRPQLHPRADAQSLLVFITEMRSADDAKALAGMAAADSPSQLATTILQHGKLVCLTVGHSTESDVPAVESTDTLRRFNEPFLDALRAAGD